MRANDEFNVIGNCEFVSERTRPIKYICDRTLPYFILLLVACLVAWLLAGWLAGVAAKREIQLLLINFKLQIFIFSL